MLSKIKVLQVVRPATGGMKEHVLALLKNLNRKDFELGLACPGDSQVGAVARELGIRVFPVDISGEITPWHDGQGTVRLAGIIRRWGVQVVHAHGAKAGLLARLSCLLVRKRPATVVTAHNFVYTGSVRGWKQKLLLGAEKRLLPLTDQFIAVSQGLRQEILNSQGIAPEKVMTIYNGLDLELFSEASDREQVRARLGLEPHRPVVGTVARFAPQKGLQYFIDMVACLEKQLPGIQYLVVGDGPLREKIESLAKSRGVREKITFTGFIADIPPILKAMDVFVLPSLSEGLGISVLEALACRRPIVATAVGGIPEIIANGENGLLVPPGSGSYLADGVAGLLNNPQLAQTLASRGFQQLEEKFSLQKMLKATEAIYHKVYRDR